MFLMITAHIAISIASNHFVDMRYPGSYAYPVKLFCLDDDEASALFGNDLRCYSTN